MRELHVVALSEDGRSVVLALREDAARGEFRVALDDRLVSAVRGELVRPGTAAAPSISPRDIQARLRDGESVEEIAASAGVPVGRVERFAGPVLAEIDRVISGAHRGFVQRARLGPSDLPLGQAVEQRLSEAAGVKPDSVRWTARRREGGAWLVEVSWIARSRRRTGGWLHDPVSGEVVAVDGASAALGHVELGREAAARPSAAARSSAARGAADSSGGAAGTRSGPSSGRVPAAATSASPRTTTTTAAAPARHAPASGRGTAGGAATAGGAPARGAAGSRTATTSGSAPGRSTSGRAGAAGAAARTTTAAGATAVGKAAAPGTPRRAAAARGSAPAAAGRSVPTSGAEAQAAAVDATSATAGRAVPARAGTAGRASAQGQAKARPGARPELQAEGQAKSQAKAQAKGSQAKSQAKGSQATGSQATGSQATGSQAKGSQAKGPVVTGPPVLRVVPPAAPDDEPAEPRRAPVARTAPDWADVLMGGAARRPPAVGDRPPD